MASEQLNLVFGLVLIFSFLFVCLLAWVLWKTRVKLVNTESQLLLATQRNTDLQAQIEYLQQTSGDLASQFKAMSNEALIAQRRQADESAELRYRETERLMAPIKESLQTMNTKIDEVEQERATSQAKLVTEISTFTQVSRDLADKTGSLRDALAKPKTRGAWGELQLQRIVEAAGMVEHCSFETQPTHTTERGIFRPDLTIQIGQGKSILIDSKVPLGAFLDAQTAPEEDIDQHLERFVSAVRTHVDQLSAKEYWQLEAGTPEFVVLFIPSDALMIDALGRDGTLLDYAAKKNIVLACPSTLISLLKTVAYGWRQESLNQNANQVLQLGRELYDRLSTMASHFNDLGKSLNRAVVQYNHTLASLESRVLVTGRRFQELNLSDKDFPETSNLDTPTRALTAGEFAAESDAPSTEPGETDQPDDNAG